MAQSSQNKSERPSGPDSQPDQAQIGAEFAKAFQELSRGEQTATALESRLNDIESRIEQLLASVENDAGQRMPLSDPSQKDGTQPGDEKKPER